MRRITERRVIFVEGPRDREFFDAFLRYLGRSDVQVIPMGGKERLKAELRVLVRGPDFDRVDALLIVRDADESEQAAFTAIQAALAEAATSAHFRPMFSIPEQPLIYAHGKPKVGAVIMPGGGRSGALEELLLEAAHEDPALALAVEFIRNAGVALKETGHRSTAPPHRLAKARIHAYLATFDEPTRHVGHAAKAGVWDFGHSSFASIRKVLLEL